MTVEEVMERDNCSWDDAFPRADAVVITGTRLMQACQAEEGLPESEKGKTLKMWLQKDQIVFARTTPA